MLRFPDLCSTKKKYMKNKFKLNSSTLLVFILTTGVFGIINTEMGVIGILPLIAENFQVSSNIRSHHPFTVFGYQPEKGDDTGTGIIYIK